MVELDPYVTCITPPGAPGLILRVAECHPLCIRAHVDSQVIEGHTR